MDTASTFFFNDSTMYEECYDAKTAPRFEPFSPDVYYMARNSGEGETYDPHNSSSTVQDEDVKELEEQHDPDMDNQDGEEGYEENSDYDSQ